MNLSNLFKHFPIIEHVYYFLKPLRKEDYKIEHILAPCLF